MEIPVRPESVCASEVKIDFHCANTDFELGPVMKWVS